ncbi:hypothetical protein [Pseudogemmobacter hezensis]|uniref:hypothetical protein n=1 Tax=Pseudogemmobacter hezensis TaxID=2737662 RepID=UPI001C12F58B|nr:hypothetical protein [Pseudogemmobacter hezensis]
MDIQPLLIREKVAAAIMGISRPTFRKWIAAGRLNEGVMIDGSRLWKCADLKNSPTLWRANWWTRD